MMLKRTASAVSRRGLLPIAAAIHAFMISGVSFQLVPLIIGAVQRDLQLSAAEIGAVPSVELGGVTLANLVGAWLIRTQRWRRLFLCGWALWIVCNLLSFAAGSAAALLALRGLAGIGGGLLSAVSTAALARAPTPERTFAASSTVQALIAAACTLATPTLLAVGSWGAPYILLGVLGIPGLFCGRVISALETPHDADRDTAVRTRGAWSSLIVLGPLGVLFSYIAMSMVWTYFGHIGANAGVAAQPTANALSLGAMACLGMSLIVAAIGNKVAQGVALLASVTFTVGAVSLAFAATGSFFFTLSVFVWSCGTGIFTPYAFAATATADATGSSTALASALSGAGIALGPILAAPFIAAEGIGGIRLPSIAFLVLGFLALAALLHRIRRPIAAAA